MENTITLISGQKIEVLMQDEVSLDIDCSLRYIESGKKEIEEYVEAVSKKRLDYIVDDAKSQMESQIEAGVIEAQEKASVSAKEVIDENISSMRSEIEGFIENEIKPTIEESKNEAVQSSQIASQSATKAVEAYNNLSASLELAQEVASGNIGDIKYTLRNSAPHGAVFCNGQILTEEQYPDLYQMLIDNRLDKVSSEEYENLITTTGKCQYFSIDEEQRTIRVPTLLQEDTDYRAYVVCYTGKDVEIDITQEITLNNPFSLLDYKWSEYEITNASWLLSNGIFHSGFVYSSVYELLLRIKNGTETKAGVSVKLSTEEYSDTDFVLNTSNSTFRLPIKVKLASSSAVVGNGMTLGLTNGENTYGMARSGAASDSGISYRNYQSTKLPYTNGTASGVTANSVFGVTTDPLKSGIETSSSGLKLYFYVGETILGANLINAGGVLTGLANKVGFADKAEVVSWVIPDYSAGVSIPAPISTAPYTCPCDLIYVACLQHKGANTLNQLYVNGIATGIGFHNSDSFTPNKDAQTIFLEKGDVIYWSATTIQATYSSKIYPLKGVN